MSGGPVTDPTTRTNARPVALEARALGPDLTRGSMLLFIALANSHYFLQGPAVLGGYPQDGSVVDSVVTWLISTFVDGRSYPLFAFLFGYGVARIVERHEGLGPRGVRQLLRRRSLVLVVVGFLHAVLLFAGDILTAYGVLLLVGAWMVRWRDRWLLITALLFLLVTALPGEGSLAVSPDPPDPSMLPPDVATMLTERPFVSLFIALLGPIGFMCPFALGLWAGRRRVLEQPQRYRTLLRVTAPVGIGVAVLGAQPVALVVSRALTAPDRPALDVLGTLHDATGVLGGLGYAALLALLALRLQPDAGGRAGHDGHPGRRGRPGHGWFVTAVAATGQLSMTCYLAQSVVWALVFTPFLLDLSDTLSVAGTAVLAIVTWLATVALADRLRRAGHRGPFEALTRRVTYGRPPA